MNLLNIKKKIPDEFYVFVNLNNMMTKHNLEFTKTFTSAIFGQLSVTPDLLPKFLTNSINYLPFIPNDESDFKVISMFNNSITSDYRIEYNCELFRKRFYPHFPSRLSCIYAFGDFKDCEIVSKKYGWNLSTVMKFKLIDNPLNRVVKVNMEIISLGRYANNVSIIDKDSQNDIWESYWNGSGNIKMELPTLNGRKEFESSEIWEYLIEGQLKLIE